MLLKKEMGRIFKAKKRGADSSPFFALNWMYFMARRLLKSLCAV
jgi:hypothetical protein